MQRVQPTAFCDRLIQRQPRGAGAIAAAVVVLVWTAGCRQAAGASEHGDASAGREAAAVLMARVSSPLAGHDAPPMQLYAGHDARGIPHYVRRAFTPDERAVLRAAYGVEDPGALYLSDSTEGALLDYDTELKRCMYCYVNSYTVGFASVRRPGESWEDLERRVHTMRRSDFPRWALVESTSLDELDPEVRPRIERMLVDAHAAGFRLRITATYRSPEREAYLFWEGGNRTHTLTSLHSYGRAIDVVVGDGNLRNATTRAAWVAFRRWVVRYDSGAFRILGRPDVSWDWPHVEIPSTDIGFRSIDDALVAARRCAASQLAPAREVLCDFQPHVPERVARPTAG